MGAPVGARRGERRRFALGARLGAPYIVATPPLENPETSHLAEQV